MINTILNKYLNNEKSGIITNYSLDGIKELLGHLKDPHKNFKSLHIAGTNGKGTTAFLLADVLKNSGYKTGLFISPHLVKINERIRINSEEISDELFFGYICRIDNIINEHPILAPTYFDIITAAAFIYFSEEKVDIAVIETGLGGRLDSTNVIIPEISIITDISMDHMQILGSNISDIAKEKCGIIKPFIPVITSNRNAEIINVIEEHSSENSSRLYAYKRNFNTENIKRVSGNFIFDYISDDNELQNIKLPLFPVHQVVNSAVAITALNHLKSNGFPDISNEIILSVFEKINVPGRFQILHDTPLIIYDPAHNFDSLKNLLDGLEEYYPDKKKIYIFSIMMDKAEKKTLNLLKNSDVMYYILNDERAYIPEDKQFKYSVSDEKKIIEILQHSAENFEMLIFTGTFRIYHHAVSIAELFKNRNIKNFKNQAELC